MIKCEKCGKEFKTTQALGGHMRFVHGIRKDSQAPLLPPKRFITDAEYNEAVTQLNKSFRSIEEVVTLLLKFKEEQLLVNNEIHKRLKEIFELFEAQSRRWVSR